MAKRIPDTIPDPYMEYDQVAKMEADMHEDNRVRLILIMKPKWGIWIEYMDASHKGSEGWKMLKKHLRICQIAQPLISRWNNKSPRDLEQMVRLYDSNDTNPVGKACWQEPLLTFIAEVVAC